MYSEQENLPNEKIDTQYDEVICDEHSLTKDVTQLNDESISFELTKKHLKKPRNVKKIILICFTTICLILLGIYISIYFYNNGVVENREMTLDIDYAYYTGLYSGSIKDGIPNGNGEFITYKGVMSNQLVYNGVFENGAFLEGVGELADINGNTVYNGKFKNGLPVYNEFKNYCQDATGKKWRDWAIYDNLFKCYSGIGRVVRVNYSDIEGFDLEIAVSISATEYIYLQYKKVDNHVFYENDYICWYGRLGNVGSDRVPEVYAYYIDTF